MSSNANIQLLDSEGTMLSGSFNLGKADEHRLHHNLTPGEYYLKVYGGETDYNLDFELHETNELSSDTLFPEQDNLDLNFDFPDYEEYLVAGISIDELLRRIWGATTGTTQFKPAEKTRNKLGQLTDGKYTVVRTLQIPHENGKFLQYNAKSQELESKSQFFKQYTGEAADTLVLDAAKVADYLGLWTDEGRKAKIFVGNGPVGVLPTGQTTSWITVHLRLGRTQRTIHGHPSAAPNETFKDIYDDNRYRTIF